MMSTNSATGSTMSHHTLRGVSFTLSSGAQALCTS